MIDTSATVERKMSASVPVKPKRKYKTPRYSPEGLAKMKEAWKRRAASPEWRANRARIMHEFYKTEAGKAFLAEKSKKTTHQNYITWESNLVRNRRVRGIKKYWTPEKRAEHAAKCKPPLANASPELKAKHRRACKIREMKKSGRLPI